VHPDEIARLIDRRDRVGELAVHLVVAVELVGVVGDAIEQVVEQRPDDAVREAFVVARDLFGRELDRHQPLLLALEPDVMRVRGRQRRRIARPAHPQPIGPPIVRTLEAGGDAAR
jgi:hypothetical protein